MKRFAERVALVAQTTHPTQAGLARLLNSLVVPPFLRRGNLWGLAWVVNLLVVAVMITTRELLAPYGLGFYFAGQLPHKFVLIILNC